MPEYKKSTKIRVLKGLPYGADFVHHDPLIVWISWAKYMFEFRKLSIQSSDPFLSHYREVSLTIVMFLVYPSKENGGYLSVTNNKA